MDHTRTYSQQFQKQIRVTIRGFQDGNQLIVFTGAHKYDSEVREACMLHAISQDTRNLRERISMAHVLIAFMGAHKYDKGFQGNFVPYSNHIAIHMFSPKWPREMWKHQVHIFIRRCCVC